MTGGGETPVTLLGPDRHSVGTTWLGKNRHSFGPIPAQTRDAKRGNVPAGWRVEPASPPKGGELGGLRA
jgi:hypothetical protein